MARWLVIRGHALIGACWWGRRLTVRWRASTRDWRGHRLEDERGNEEVVVRNDLEIGRKRMSIAGEFGGI